MPKVFRNDGPNDNELPTYEDVVREDQQRVQGSQSAPVVTSSRPSSSRPHHISSRPPAPPPAPLPPKHSSPASSSTRIPWRYPTGFYCAKCGNTGYKIKNGRSCKSCWRRFAPSNKSNAIPTLTYSNNYQSAFNPFFPSPLSSKPIFQSTPAFGQQQAPLVVSPGDPRLGGVPCGECRGTGRVTFLLDEDICPLCRGIGRIVT